MKSKTPKREGDQIPLWLIFGLLVVPVKAAKSNRAKDPYSVNCKCRVFKSPVFSFS